MDIGTVTKKIMKERRVTQTMLGEIMGVNQNTVSKALANTPSGMKDRIKILEILGYEVIVREKRPGRRAEGEYVVTVGKGEEKEKPAEEGGEAYINNEEKPRKTVETKGDIKTKPVDIEEGIRLLREQIALANGEALK